MKEGIRLGWVIIVLFMLGVVEISPFLLDGKPVPSSDGEVLGLWIFDGGVYYRIDASGRIVGSTIRPPGPNDWVFSDVKWEVVSGYRSRLTSRDRNIISEFVQLFPNLVGYVSDVRVSSNVVYVVGRKKIEFADWEIVFEYPEVFAECVTTRAVGVSMKILNDGSVLRVGW